MVLGHRIVSCFPLHAPRFLEAVLSEGLCALPPRGSQPRQAHDGVCARRLGSTNVKVEPQGGNGGLPMVGLTNGSSFSEGYGQLQRHAYEAQVRINVFRSKVISRGDASHSEMS